MKQALNDSVLFVVLAVIIVALVIDIKIVGEIIMTSGISNPVAIEDVAIEKNQSVGSLRKIHN